MASTKINCPKCSEIVYEVQKNIGGLILLDPKKIEIAYGIINNTSYATQTGWKIHSC